jgi:hypothetical protein
MPDEPEILYTIRPVTAEWTSKTERGKTTGTCVWLVTASLPVTPYQAERATADGTTLPITAIGQTMPGTTAGVPCVSRSAAAVDQTRQLYRVTCDYDSTSTVAENPLSEATKVSYDIEGSEAGYFKDESPTPKLAQTTAGEPFPELPKRDSGGLVINIEKNVAHTTNYAAYEGFIKPKVNAGTVTIDGRNYAAGTLKTTPPRLSEVKEQNGVRYRTLTVTLKANADGWQQKYESRGLWEKSGGTYRRIAGADGAPVETPWPLNADGSKKSSSTDAGAEIVLTPYASADISSLV